MSWNGSVTPAGTSTHYQTDSTAIYGFDTLEFNEHWQASAGLRLDHYGTEAHPSQGESLESSDNFLNSRLGLVYKPVSFGSIYLSHSTATTPEPLAGGNFDDLHGDTRFGASNEDLQPE